MEWFCLGCNTVFEAADDYGLHCKGKGLVPFSPIEHSRLLISASNAWNTIDGKWDSHPLYEEVRQEHFTRGSYGAARILISFVERLIEGYNPRA